jgi:choline-sulfatase
MPTILTWATNEDPRELELDGQTLDPLLAGGRLDGAGGAVGELLSEGVNEPQVMIRRGDHKFIRCPGDPDLLYDLPTDPSERENWSDDERYRAALGAGRAEADARWDVTELGEMVRRSQRRRHIVLSGLSRVSHAAWEYAPAYSGTGRYLTSSSDFWDHANRSRLPCPLGDPRANRLGLGTVSRRGHWAAWYGRSL